MDHGLTLHPVAIDAWLLLRDLPRQLQRVEVWRARHHPPAAGAPHQHACTTLVACLRGVTRVEHPNDQVDLHPGEVLLIRPGAWHRHAPLRGDGLALFQGFLGGRSDFFLDTPDLHLTGSVPAEPSQRLMERAAREGHSQARRALVGELISNLTRERTAPLTAPHPALARMEMALWQHLHRPDAQQAIISASGLSRAQAYRLFTAHWGAGIASILRRERIRLAQELISDGVATREAARRCGFSNQRTFARAYAGIVGSLPGSTAVAATNGTSSSA